MHSPRLSPLAGCLAGLLLPVAVAAAETAQWPSFRGPNASGIAETETTATEWNVPEGIGVKWKTPIPGLAHSSPVIWGDRLFVTSAVSDDPDPYLRVGLYGESPDHPEDIPHDFKLYCLDKSTGTITWEQTAIRAKPKVKRHIKASHANSTPATNGEVVVALFGSEGLYAYDMDGKLLWSKDLGLLDSGAFNVPSIQWGFGSSPRIHRDRVIVQCDVNNQSFLASFEVKTGREIWRTPRDEQPGWGTPSIVEHDNRTEIICNGYKHIGGYDFHTGKETWKMRGGGDIPVPTPVVAGEMIYITNAHGPLAPIYAIKTNATGDITLTDGRTENRFVAWSHRRRGSYMQTPLVYRNLLYGARDNGALTVYDAQTGKSVYKKRLAGGRTGFTASPIAADGKIYYTSEEGTVIVLAAGDKFRQLASNDLGEICMATPAVSDGTLFFRTRHHLVAIAPPSAESKNKP